MAENQCEDIELPERIRHGSARDNPVPLSESFSNLALTPTKIKSKNAKTTLKHRRRRSQLYSSQRCSFSFLPADCLLLIFSFLAEVEKCRAAMVCASWAKTMRSPQLWRVGNFLRLGAYTPGMPGVMVSVQEFERWHEWVYKYAFHLTSRCAGLRVLLIGFDLQNQKAKWTDFFLQFLDEAQCSELQELEFNWTLTHAKFYGFFESGVFATLSPEMTEQFSSFLIVIEKFTQCSPKLCKMKLPFDWSERSVALLINFNQLHTLELNHFWHAKAVSPKTMQFLARSLPKLKVFTLQITVPVQDFGIAYPLSSLSLQYLDVTKSQGFVFSILDLPSLKELRVRAVRETMRIPPADLAVQSRWACLYKLLKSGTPSLQVLNAHVLLPRWQEASYQELAEVIRKACSCIHHNCLV